MERSNYPMYVIEGPRLIGGTFGYSGRTLLKGEFAIVRNGEYADGGFGPIMVVKKIFASRLTASEAMAAMIPQAIPVLDDSCLVHRLA